MDYITEEQKEEVIMKGLKINEISLDKLRETFLNHYQKKSIENEIKKLKDLIKEIIRKSIKRSYDMICYDNEQNAKWVDRICEEDFIEFKSERIYLNFRKYASKILMKIKTEEIEKLS